MKDETLVSLNVNVKPEVLRKLLCVRQMACPDESWDKTIGDVFDIAMERYEMLYQRSLKKKESE